jgi:predicted nucleotidyltransferase
MFGLPETVLKKIVDSLKEYPKITWAKIYGSRAKGNYRTGSDIDLAISSEVDISGKLLSTLEELPTPYLFDVTHYESLRNEELKSHIDRVGKIIYMRKLKK